MSIDITYKHRWLFLSYRFSLNLKRINQLRRGRKACLFSANLSEKKNPK